MNAPPVVSTRAPNADRSSRSRSWLAPLLAAAGLAGALVIVYALAFHVSTVSRWDARALNGFLLVERPHTDSVAKFFVDSVNPVQFTVIAVGLAIIALIRRRPILVAAEAFILLAANLSTEALKPLVGAHETIVLGALASSTAAFPSGHATAAMALALCAVIVTPRRLRPMVAAAGALYSFAVGCGLVLLGTHYPTDVIAGYLMSGTWTLLVLVVLWGVFAPGRVHTRRSWIPAALDATTPVAWAFAAMVGAVGLATAAAPPILGAASVAFAAIAVGFAAVVVTAIVATLSTSR